MQKKSDFEQSLTLVRNMRIIRQIKITFRQQTVRKYPAISPRSLRSPPTCQDFVHTVYARLFQLQNGGFSVVQEEKLIEMLLGI